MRPVVNNRTVSAYKAAKKLNTIPNNHLHLENQYNVINSNTLAKVLIQLKINNKHRLLTLDIKDLYVNIPIKETIHITETQLLMHNDKLITNQIIMLLETIWDKTISLSRTKYINLIRASPWPPNLRNCGRDFPTTGKTHVKHRIDSEHLIFYARYVDDIHVICDYTLTSPTNIQHYMDTIHGKIKLNATHETNDKINFLDF